MKSQLTKLFYFFALSIFILSCKTESSQPEIKPSDTEKVDESCYPNSKKPSQIITYEEMDDMLTTFYNGPKKELDKYLKKVSGGKRSVSTVYNWYNIDDLKQYIAYIERISKEKDIPLTGFRIYPSTYPKNYKDKELRNVQTLIFTPTTKVGDKNDVAFEPLYSEKGKPAEIQQFLNKVRAKKVNTAGILNLNMQDGLESSSANRLNPTPPPY
ncbi:hypothetical protein [Polaribacter sp. M15]